LHSFSCNKYPNNVQSLQQTTQRLWRARFYTTFHSSLWPFLLPFFLFLLFFLSAGAAARGSAVSMAASVRFTTLIASWTATCITQFGAKAQAAATRLVLRELQGLNLAVIVEIVAFSGIAACFFHAHRDGNSCTRGKSERA